MNPSLPNEDLVFCLKFPILNLTQRLLEGQYVVEGFPQHGLHAVHVVYVARSVGGSYIFLGNIYPLTGRNSRPIPAKIYAIDVVGGGKTGCRSHPQSAERLKEREENVWSVG